MLARGLEAREGIWPPRERRAWTFTLFVGLLLVFMSKTAGPVTMVTLAKEFEWGKERQVLLLMFLELHNNERFNSWGSHVGPLPGAYPLPLSWGLQIAHHIFK